MTTLLNYLCVSLSLCANYSFVNEYAPRIYMDKQERYFPSSIEYFSMYSDLTIINGKIWAESIDLPKSPTSTLPYFEGQNVTTQQPPVYAIVMPSPDEVDPVTAINNPLNHTVVVTYFSFYPYNRGKEMFGTVWDNHIADIEHTHVYFRNGIPYRVVASYHSWNTTKEWGDPSIEMVNGTNHFVLYSARGSHGLWFSTGSHRYHTVLYDETSRSEKWDTWDNVKVVTPYDWNNQLAYHGKQWLIHVYRWGNPGSSFSGGDNCIFGYCRFGRGPIGMLGKTHIRKTLNNLKKRGYVCDSGCVWNSGIY